MAQEEKTKEERPKKEPKGKKQKGKKKPTQVWKLYETSGGLKKKNKSCPKCGAGFFMAKHANRSTCGNCGYTEFESRK